MLPPIEESVLQSNPKFVILHNSLARNVLNHSGSTRQHPAQKERDAVSEALRAARKRASKSHLLLTAITNLNLSNPSPSNTTKRDSKSPSQPEAQKPLPADLIELVLLISAHLTTPSLPKSSVKALESTEQWNTLHTHLPAIGALLSTFLQNQALALARIANPSTNPSFLHRGIPKLCSHVEDLQDANQDKRTALQARRMDLVGKTTTLLGIYHVAISLIIRILEQSKHGSIARQVKSKADYLNVVAKTVELETKGKGVRGHKLVYTEEVNEALGNYMRNLRDGRERLRERRSDAERVLWGYGVGREDGEKEKVMKEIAKVYRELTRELREVGRDVERLEGK